MHINLKALLHLSKSIVPNESLQRQKNVKCGKKRYLIRFELTGADILIIKQIKTIKKKVNLASGQLGNRKCQLNKSGKLKKFKTVEDKFPTQRISQSFIKSTINQKCQTEFTKEKCRQSLSDKNVQTNDIHLIDQPKESIIKSNVDQKDQINQTCIVAKSSKLYINKVCQSDYDYQIDEANQTDLLNKRHIKLDTEDLKLTYTRDQQTDILYHQSTTTQTQIRTRSVIYTQTQVQYKEKCMQTKILQSTVVVQTDPYKTTVSTQTGGCNLHACVQTVDCKKVELSRPHEEVFTLMITSLREQSELLQTGVLDALNHLTDLTLLGLKKDHDQSKDYFGLILDIPSEGKNLLTVRDKNKSLLKYRTWKCPMKCKACGLHKHRILPRTAVTEIATDCQGTQTEGDTTKVPIIRFEVATQTDKLKLHKKRWILR